VKFAWVLGLIYGVVQIVVFVGVIWSVATVYPVYCDSNAIFLFLVLGVFTVCGLLHPLELFTLVIKGIVYYLYIPTMSLLLMIYAICNLNVTSWGTREKEVKDPTVQTLDEVEEDHGPRELSASCCSTSGSYDLFEARERYYNSSSRGSSLFLY